MEEDVKICPNCGSEFFAHVERCNKCDISLDIAGDLETFEMVDDVEGGELVLVETGEPERMKWLAAKLKNAGFCPSVFNLSEVDSCCGGGVYGIFVDDTRADAAAKKVKEILLENHPELGKVEELVSGGRCPACTAEVPYGIGECPECGLNLGGTDPSCGTGGCGPGS